MSYNTSLESVLFFKPDPSEKYIYKKTARVPVVNIDVTDEHYLLTVAVPGFKREQFEILISYQIIFIRSTAKNSTQKSVKDRCEYDYTNWSRAFILPDDTDIILAKASYHNGELIIRIPRGEGDTSIKDTLTVYVD